jgi:hypothetical protein
VRKIKDSTFVSSPTWTDGINNVCHSISGTRITYTYPDYPAWVCGTCGMYFEEREEYVEHCKSRNVEYKSIDIIHAPGALVAPPANESLARIATALERIAGALEERGL